MRSSSTGTLGRSIAAVCGALVLLVLGAPGAAAHPLGNFTVNFHSGIRVEPTAVAVAVVEDQAEIPTVQTFPTAATGVDDSTAAAFRSQRCTELARTAELRLDGVRRPLSVVGSDLTFPPGAAGLPTSRLTCELRTSEELDPVGAALGYRLSFEADRLGWREITAVGDGVELIDSTVPTVSPSQTLRAYPEDLLASPVHVTDATMQVRSGSGVVAGPAPAGAPSDSLSRGVDRLTAAYTDLIASRELTVPFGLLAVVLAVVLGAMHAFAPGHGKALMAATLVGREGTLRQAVTIGLSVTVTHSLGVLVLGLALSFTALAAPEQVYPWLGLISGVLLVAIGTTLLRAALRRPAPTGATMAPAHEHGGHEHGGHEHGGHEHGGHEHGHGAGVHHHHAPEPHSHGFFSHTHQPAQLGTRSLLAVGFTGGLVPSPSALLVLLGGIALGRAWFGVVLVVAYGVGMAAALVAVGLALVKCRDWLERQLDRLSVQGHSAGALLIRRWVPLATSTLVILIGLGVAARAAAVI